MRTALAILISGLAAAQAYAGVDGANHWYTRTYAGQWCAWAGAKPWTQQTAESYASARISGGKVQAIEIYDSDESGDWGLVDAYRFDGGKISRLDRVYTSFNYSRIRERYALRSGRMVRLWRRYVTEDDKPEKPADIRRPEGVDGLGPVYVRLGVMPFSTVLFEKPKSGKVCKPATPDNPATRPASKPPAAKAGRRP